MKNLLFIAVLVGLCAFTIKNAFPIEGKKVTVYTTAADTSLRLTPTEVIEFSDFGQPFETQPCIFVDASKTYQTFMGIGAALTDASAEVYAKLSKEKQQEFMQGRTEMS